MIKPLLKILIILSLIGNASGLLAQQEKSEAPDLDRFEADIVAFEEADKVDPPVENSILFVGSSSIRMWNTLKRDMKPLRVINRGFGGSTFAELIYYYDRIVKPYKPRTIVVYEGDNDLADGTGPGTVLSDLKRFNRMVQADFPGVKVWFIAIKPSIARKNLLSKIQKTNSLIEKHAAKTNTLGFMDVATPMLNNNGSIRDDIFLQDNLHLNEKGYEIWKKVVKPPLMGAYSRKATN